MSNQLYLFIGKSASGKTTIANLLEEKYGHKQVYSYTTRPRRCDNEIGHIFINEEEFNHLGKLAAYTFYNGYHYGTTFEQLNECDIYVIDVPGVENLLENMKYDDRNICIIYFDAAVSTRIERMVDRGASDMEIIKRLYHDDTENDWYKTLDNIIRYYRSVGSKKIQLHRIDANENIENVLEQVLYYMNDKTSKRGYLI